MLLVSVLLVALLSGLLLLLLWEDRKGALHRAAPGRLTGWWTTAERRSRKRRQVALDVWYEVLIAAGADTVEHHQAVSDNVSEGGICLRLYERLNPRTTLKFEILLPHDPAPVCGTGEVRWTRERELAGARRTFLSGIQFVDLHPSERDRLSRTLRRMERSKRPTPH